jgi:hypothetical protein
MIRLATNNPYGLCHTFFLRVASRNNNDDDARIYFAAVSANTSLGIHLGREEALK